MRASHISTLLFAAGILAAVGYTSFAFTAANTVPAQVAGSGTGAITAYTASNIDYTLNALIPFNIDAVTFTLSPTSAGAVKVVLNGSAYACTNTAGSVSCTTTSPVATVIPVNTLKVVAAT